MAAQQHQHQPTLCNPDCAVDRGFQERTQADRYYICNDLLLYSLTVSKFCKNNTFNIRLLHFLNISLLDDREIFNLIILKTICNPLIFSLILTKHYHSTTLTGN